MSLLRALSIAALLSLLACTRAPRFGDTIPEWRLAGCIELIEGERCVPPPGRRLVAWAAVPRPFDWVVRVDGRWRAVPGKHEVRDDGVTSTLQLPKGALELRLEGTALRVRIESRAWAGIPDLAALARSDPARALAKIEALSPEDEVHAVHLSYAGWLAERRLEGVAPRSIERLRQRAMEVGALRLASDLSAVVAYRRAATRDVFGLEALLGAWPDGPTSHIDEAHTRARLAYTVGDFAAALRFAERAVREAERVSDPVAQTDARVMAAGALGQLGLPGDGARLLAGAEVAGPCMEAALTSTEGWLWLEANDLDRAQASLERALGAKCPRGASEALLLNQSALALRTDEIAQAQQHLDRALVAFGGASLDYLEAKAGVAARAGRDARAVEAYAALEARARASARPDIVALARFGRSRVEVEAAGEHLEAALAALEEWTLGAPTGELRGAALSLRAALMDEVTRTLLARGDLETALESHLGLARLVHPRRARLAPHARAALAEKRLTLIAEEAQRWRRPSDEATPSLERLRSEIVDLQARAVPVKAEPRDAEGLLIVAMPDGAAIWRKDGRYERVARTPEAVSALVERLELPPGTPLPLVGFSLDEEVEIRKGRFGETTLGRAYPVLQSVSGLGPRLGANVAGAFAIDDANRSAPLRAARLGVSEALQGSGWRSLHTGSWEELTEDLSSAPALLFAGHAAAPGPRSPGALEFGLGTWPARMLLALPRAPSFVALIACRAGALDAQDGTPLDLSLGPALIRAGAELVVAPAENITAEQGAALLTGLSSALAQTHTPLEAWMALHAKPPPGLDLVRAMVP